MSLALLPRSLRFKIAEVQWAEVRTRCSLLLNATSQPPLLCVMVRGLPATNSEAMTTNEGLRRVWASTGPSTLSSSKRPTL